MAGIKQADSTAIDSGWQYIKLPQSIFLIDPSGKRHYMGYADPRFRYIKEAKYSFQEICTYSFLGCGEFYQAEHGLWTNKSFSVPGQVLSLLLEIPENQREPLFNIWKNIYTRDPELLTQLGDSLKSIRPFTEDGMVIMSEHDIAGELKEKLARHKIRFIQNRGQAKMFEEVMRNWKLPETRLFKRLVLEHVLYHNLRATIWMAISVLYRAYGLDRTQTMLQTKTNVDMGWLGSGDDSFTEDILVPFLQGLNPEQLDQCVKTGLLAKLKQVSPGLLSKFDFRKTRTGKPDFWEFMRRNRITLTQLPVYLDALELGEEVFRPLEFPVKVLARNKEFTIRSPETGLELVEWGFILKNCLKSYFKRIMEESRETWIFGIFQKNDLVGAVQIGNKSTAADIRQIDINQLRTTCNGEFKADDLVQLKNLIVSSCMKNTKLKKYWGIKSKKKKFRDLDMVERQRLVERIQKELKGALKKHIGQKANSRDIQKTIQEYTDKLYGDGVIQVKIGREDMPDVMGLMGDFFFKNRLL